MEGPLNSLRLLEIAGGKYLVKRVIVDDVEYAIRASQPVQNCFERFIFNLRILYCSVPSEKQMKGLRYDIVEF